MKLLQVNTLNHGYLIYGNKDKALNLAEEAASQALGTPQKELNSHPDFSQYRAETFGIDESRELKIRASTKPVKGDGKIFIINFESATLEAQNALLKLFEEPPPGTHFFIIVPNLEILLPTLASRLVSINAGPELLAEEKINEINRFLKTNPAKRLDFVKKIIDKKDKTLAIEFLNALEAALGQKIENRASAASTIEDIQKNREFLKAKGASIKLVLEYIALAI
jgi:DNA polymerase-3 subunit delta'